MNCPNQEYPLMPKIKQLFKKQKIAVNDFEFNYLEKRFYLMLQFLQHFRTRFYSLKDIYLSKDILFFDGALLSIEQDVNTLYHAINPKFNN
jgi:hypothetical protein